MIRFYNYFYNYFYILSYRASLLVFLARALAFSSLMYLAVYTNFLESGAPEIDNTSEQLQQEESVAVGLNENQESQANSLKDRESKENKESTSKKTSLLRIGVQDIARNYKVALRPYGFLRHQTHWDTRQEFGSPELQAPLFPQPYLPDVLCRDINAHPGFHMTPIETRIGFMLRGPDWFEKVHIQGLVEGDFKGDSLFSLSCFTLRHIYSVINWQTGALLIGQYWSPLYAEDSRPREIAFNGGTPFEIIARFPQFRLTQQFNITDNGAFEVIAAALTQRDFRSFGPIGFDTSYIRNAIVPNLHLHFRSLCEDTIFGVAFDYKRLVPRLVSNKDYKVNEHVDSFIAEAYAAFNTKPFSIRFKGLYAQNATEHSNISGYAVATVDPITDFRTYAPTANANFWLDANYSFPDDKTEVGIYIGYSRGLGASRKLYINPATDQPIIYNLPVALQLGEEAALEVARRPLQEIEYLFRIAPRITYFWKPLYFALQMSTTAASWGRPDEFGRVKNGKLVANLRTTFIIDYVF